MLALYSKIREETKLNIEENKVNTQTIFDIPKWQSLFTDELEPLAKGQAIASVLGVHDEFDMSIDISEYEENIKVMVDSQLELVKTSVFNTHEDLKGKMSKILTDRTLNKEDLAKKLIEQTEDYFDDSYTQGKATQIAQNTTSYIENKAKHEVALKRGLDKVWVTRRDKRVRPSHAKLDGTKLSADGSFAVVTLNSDGSVRTTNDAQFPKDTGDPSEDINCRCLIKLSR